MLGRQGRSVGQAVTLTLSRSLVLTTLDRALSARLRPAAGRAAVAGETRADRRIPQRARSRNGQIPGAVVLIQRHGKPVYFKWFGKRDVDAGIEMTPDAIFPLHSLTKTVTSFAAMMLVDRGRIALDDPVSKYIPSFAGMKVGVERKDETGKAVLDLVPLRRPVTIEDLLLHTSGITYGFYGDEGW